MPGVTTNAKCGPDVGGVELYRTEAMAACDTCGLAMSGTAVPGRQASTRSGAVEPTAVAVSCRHWPTNVVTRMTASTAPVPSRQSHRRGTGVIAVVLPAVTGVPVVRARPAR